MKNPKIAAALNIIPGVGYLYAGRKVQFAILLITGLTLSVVASTMNPLLEQYNNATTYNFWDQVAVIGTLLFVAGFMYDAYHETAIHNSQVK